MLEHARRSEAVGSCPADDRQLGGRSDRRVGPDAGFEEGADDDRHSRCCGSRGDLTEHARAPDARRLDHEHVGGAGGKSLGGGLVGVYRLVERDRDAAFPPKFGVPLQVTRSERLLQVLDVVDRQGVEPLNGHGERPAAVGVEPEPDRLGNDMPDRRDQVHQVGCALRADLELDAGESVGHRLLRGFGSLRRS